MTAGAPTSAEASNPRISVVLPVYNGQSFIREAIQSVLSQTYRNFELIVINDGSTDETAAVIAEISDARMKVVHQRNIGLALTLNKGIGLAKGDYIARQDADDISLPDRFARQLDYLDAHPACALLGTWSVIQDEAGRRDREHRHPCANGELQFRLLFDSFFVHSSVMLRRSALDRVGLYPTDPERNPPEDFDLWLRIADRFEIANLAQPLIIYREVAGSISRTKMDLLNRRAVGMAVENLRRVLGNDWSEANLRDLVAMLRHSPEYVSPKPDWPGLDRLLLAIEARLCTKWPNDASDIRQGYSQARRIVRQARLGNNPVGVGARKIRALLRRFALFE